VRFGKKTKNTSFFSRGEAPAPEEASFSPVAAHERDALLGDNDDDGAYPDAPQAPETKEVAQDNDPTQPLLTALGRFHREVTKVKDGADRPNWTDECMNQLIGAVEIAMGQDWPDMVETLTETARILQTYEEADQAEDAIPFLDESYQILCLMVGNILVGSRRNDAIGKWESCYHQALEDLTSRGLALVADEGETPFHERRAQSDRDQSENDADAALQQTNEDDSPFPFDGPDPINKATGTDAPEERDEEPTNPEPAVEDAETAPSSEPHPDQSTAPVNEETDPAAGVAQVLDTLCDSFSRLEKGEDIDDTFGAIYESIAFLEDYASEHNHLAAIPACDTLRRLCRQAQAVGLDEDKFFEVAFGFCEAYAQAQRDEDSRETNNWIMECESLLHNWTTSEEPPETEVPQTEEAAMETAESFNEEAEAEPHDESAIEPAPWESDEKITEDADQEPAVKMPALDSESLQEEDNQALTDGATEPDHAAESPDEIEEISSVPETPEQTEAGDSTNLEEPDLAAAPPVVEEEGALIAEEGDLETPLTLDEDDDSSPLRMLAIAQQLASQGRGADAKLLALRAAAAIAADEADQCEARLNDAERRLQEGASAIDAARQRVVEAEKAVEQAESGIQETEATLTAQNQTVAEIDSAISSVEETIADLERQIAELQRKRDEELETLSEERQRSEEARGRASELESALEAGRQSEEASRRTLEDARQDVKTSEMRRREIETEREQIQEELLLQRNSLSELTETIQHVAGKREKGKTDEDLLF